MKSVYPIRVEWVGGVGDAFCVFNRWEDGIFKCGDVYLVVDGLVFKYQAGLWDVKKVEEYGFMGYISNSRLTGEGAIFIEEDAPIKRLRQLKTNGAIHRLMDIEDELVVLYLRDEREAMLLKPKEIYEEVKESGRYKQFLYWYCQSKNPDNVSSDVGIAVKIKGKTYRIVKHLRSLVAFEIAPQIVMDYEGRIWKIEDRNDLVRLAEQFINYRDEMWAKGKVCR